MEEEHSERKVSDFYAWLETRLPRPMDAIVDAIIDPLQEQGMENSVIVSVLKQLSTDCKVMLTPLAKELVQQHLNKSLNKKNISVECDDIINISSDESSDDEPCIPQNRRTVKLPDDEDSGVEESENEIIPPNLIEVSIKVCGPGNTKSKPACMEVNRVIKTVTLPDQSNHTLRIDVSVLDSKPLNESNLTCSGSEIRSETINNKKRKAVECSGEDSNGVPVSIVNNVDKKKSKSKLGKKSTNSAKDSSVDSVAKKKKGKRKYSDITEQNITQSRQENRLTEETQVKLVDISQSSGKEKKRRKISKTRKSSTKENKNTATTISLCDATVSSISKVAKNNFIDQVWNTLGMESPVERSGQFWKSSCPLTSDLQIFTTPTCDEQASLQSIENSQKDSVVDKFSNISDVPNIQILAVDSNKRNTASTDVEGNTNTGLVPVSALCRVATACLEDITNAGATTVRIQQKAVESETAPPQLENIINAAASSVLPLEGENVESEVETPQIEGITNTGASSVLPLEGENVESEVETPQIESITNAGESSVLRLEDENVESEVETPQIETITNAGASSFLRLEDENIESEVETPQIESITNAGVSSVLHLEDNNVESEVEGFITSIPCLQQVTTPRDSVITINKEPETCVSNIGKIRVRDPKTLMKCYENSSVTVVHCNERPNFPSLLEQNKTVINPIASSNTILDFLQNLQHSHPPTEMRQEELSGVKESLNNPVNVQKAFYKWFFDQDVELKSAQMAEILHLVIADKICKDNRIKSASKLMSESSIADEKRRVDREYSETLRIRGSDFKVFFNSVIENVCLLPNLRLIIASLYYKIINALVKIEETNRKYVLSARFLICEMLKKNSYKEQLVYEIFSPSNNFEQKHHTLFAFLSSLKPQSDTDKSSSSNMCANESISHGEELQILSGCNELSLEFELGTNLDQPVQNKEQHINVLQPNQINSNCQQEIVHRTVNKTSESERIAIKSSTVSRLEALNTSIQSTSRSSINPVSNFKNPRNILPVQSVLPNSTHQQVNSVLPPSYNSVHQIIKNNQNIVNQFSVYPQNRNNCNIQQNTTPARSSGQANRAPVNLFGQFYQFPHIQQTQNIQLPTEKSSNYRQLSTERQQALLAPRGYALLPPQTQQNRQPLEIQRGATQNMYNEAKQNNYRCGSQFIQQYSQLQNNFRTQQTSAATSSVEQNLQKQTDQRDSHLSSLLARPVQSAYIQTSGPTQVETRQTSNAIQNQDRSSQSVANNFVKPNPHAISYARLRQTSAIQNVKSAVAKPTTNKETENCNIQGRQEHTSAVKQYNVHNLKQSTNSLLRTSLILSLPQTQSCTSVPVQPNWRSEQTGTQKHLENQAVLPNRSESNQTVTSPQNYISPNPDLRFVNGPSSTLSRLSEPPRRNSQYQASSSRSPQKSPNWSSNNQTSEQPVNKCEEFISLIQHNSVSLNITNNNQNGSVNTPTGSKAQQSLIPANAQSLHAEEQPNVIMDRQGTTLQGHLGVMNSQGTIKKSVFTPQQQPNVMNDQDTTTKSVIRPQEYLSKDQVDRNKAVEGILSQPVNDQTAFGKYLDARHTIDRLNLSQASPQKNRKQTAYGNYLAARQSLDGLSSSSPDDRVPAERATTQSMSRLQSPSCNTDNSLQRTSHNVTKPFVMVQPVNQSERYQDRVAADTFPGEIKIHSVHSLPPDTYDNRQQDNTDSSRQKKICANPICSEEAMVLCSSCRSTFYCSKNCQAHHWYQGHHEVCSSNLNL